MLRRTRPVSGVSELYPVRPGAKPWKAADDGREGGILHQRALSAPRIQAGEGWLPPFRSEEHTSELQSLMRISYAVFCFKKNKRTKQSNYKHTTHYYTA